MFSFAADDDVHCCRRLPLAHLEHGRGDQPGSDRLDSLVPATRSPSEDVTASE